MFFPDRQCRPTDNLSRSWQVRRGSVGPLIPQSDHATNKPTNHHRDNVNERVPKVVTNDAINVFFETAISILEISNHNSFRVLFDKIACVYFIRKDTFIF